jgi:hypothetical protein
MPASARISIASPSDLRSSAASRIAEDLPYTVT